MTKSRPLGLFDAFHHEAYVVGGVTELFSGPIKDTHVGDRLNTELADDRGVPIHDINFEQSDIRVGLGQLFELRADPAAGAAPLGIEIHNSDLAWSHERKQVHLLTPIGNSSYFLPSEGGSFHPGSVLGGSSCVRT